MNLKFLPIIAICLTCGFVSKATGNINNIREEANSRPIQFPESFETDTKKMLENWYLRNYAVLDKNSERRQSVPADDDVIIERLGKIPTTIELPFNSVVKAYITTYTEKRKQLVENMLGLSMYYMPIFEQYLDRYDLPLELKYLPVIESALNPVAVSKVGATGLWQFMLPTASGLGLEKNTLIDERCDPHKSSEAAARFLKELYGYYSDWGLVLAAYNCGTGTVNKALRRAGGGKKDFWDIYPYLPAETKGYVPAFIAAVYVMNYFDQHNISPVLARKPLVTDTVMVNRRVYFEQISEVLDIPMDELRVLNPQYRKDVVPGDIKPYSIVLPSLQTYAYIANEDTIVNHNATKFARREVVEPSTGASVEGSDSKGKYVDEVVVKYHKVRRGETLTSIAKKYGVTAKSLRNNNKIGKSVKAGQTLAIQTVNRKYVPDEEPADTLQPIETPVLNDSIDISSDTAERPAVTDSSDTQEPDTLDQQAPAEDEPKAQPQKASVKEKAKKAPAKAKEPQPTTHKVKKGETLSSIAARNGITVNELKKANGMKNDKLQSGQTLTIPAKKAATKKSSKKRR